MSPSRRDPWRAPWLENRRSLSSSVSLVKHVPRHAAASGRVTISDVPPGGNGLMIVMAREGASAAAKPTFVQVASHTEHEPAHVLAELKREMGRQPCHDRIVW